MAVIIMVVLLARFMPESVYAVNAWSPTLLVNSESFQQIAHGDGSTNVELQFGASTSTLKLLTTNTFQFNKSLSVVGGISGSYLTIDQQANISGALLVKNSITSRSTISGANLTFMGATSSYILGSLGIGKSGTPNTKLEVVGTISGTTLNANMLLTGSTIQGFGLYDCQGISNKLTYNATTKKFLCEADQSGGSSGGGSNWSNTGSLQSAFDTRFVNQSGDTMTGALSIQNGNTHTPIVTPLLNVRGTISGALLRASNMTVSGAVVYSSGNTLKQNAKGLSGQVLIAQGTSAPKWASPVGGMIWYFDGTQTIATSKGPEITMPFGLTLSGVTLKAKGAPTGAAFIIDINKDGTTIFSTRPQIYAGGRAGGTGAVFSTTNLTLNSVLTIDIDQVGSTFAGSGITVMLKGTRKY